MRWRFAGKLYDTDGYCGILHMYLRILALGAPAFTAAELSVVQTVRADGLVVQLGQHRRADGVSRHG